MAQIMEYLPELTGPERFYVQDLIAQMSRDQAHMFTNEYRRKRKDPQTVLLAAIVGLVGCPGFQRFWLGEIGMGFLFLLTGGLLLMGSIIDVATYKTLAFSYNQRVAQRIVTEIRKLEHVKSTTPFADQRRQSPRLNRQSSVYGDLIIQ